VKGPDIIMRGFTLVELVIVLMIMALAGAIVLPAIIGGFQEESLSSSGQRIITYLREAQREAMRRGRALTVRIDDKEGRIWYKEGEGIRLPEELRLESKTGEIVFYPDGTALEREVSIISQGGASLRIVVDPFSGLAKRTGLEISKFLNFSGGARVKKAV